MNKLKKWEISLLIGFFAALVIGGFASARTPLSDKLLRLHVIAASDDPADQAIKLEVRDVVLGELAGPLSGAAGEAEAEAIVAGMLPELKSAVEEYLRSRSSPLSVTVELTQCAFPTKDYGAFALPAGSYRALRVVLDEGKGQNWWCVIFPPLCAATAVKEVEQASLSGGLTEDEAKLITRGGESYVIRFKFLEWIGALKNIIWK